MMAVLVRQVLADLRQPLLRHVIGDSDSVISFLPLLVRSQNRLKDLRRRPMPVDMMSHLVSEQSHRRPSVLAVYIDFRLPPGENPKTGFCIVEGKHYVGMLVR